MLTGQLSAGALGDGVDIAFSVEGKKMSGYSTYHLDFSTWYLFYDETVMVNGASELEFPLDVYWGFANIEIKGNLFQRLGFAIGVDIGKNISESDGYMIDSDWMRVPGYNFDHMISYTESDNEIEARHLGVYARVRLWKDQRITLDGMAGYKYQKFTYEVTGLRGWYLDGDLEQLPYDESQYIGVNVGDYEVMYYIPYLGFHANIKAYPSLSFNAEAAVSPYVTARDWDDHLLRKKTGEGDCTGAAFFADGSADYTLDGPVWGLNWVFELGYELQTISTSGDQTQTWYGDDPATPFDDTGNQSKGLSYKIKSLQKSVRFKISCLF